MSTDIKKLLIEAVERKIEKNYFNLERMEVKMKENFIQFFQYESEQCYQLHKENEILTALKADIENTEVTELDKMVKYGIEFYTRKIMTSRPYAGTSNLMVNIAEMNNNILDKEMYGFYKGLEYILKHNS